MFDITVYYVDGKRGMYDHVESIVHDEDEVIINFCTDFDDKLVKSIQTEEIDTIKVRLMI